MAAPRKWTKERFWSVFRFEPGDAAAEKKFGREFGYIPRIVEGKLQRETVKRTKVDEELAYYRSGKAKV